MKQYLLVFSALFLLCASLSAQLIVDSSTYTEQELIQDILVGEGVQVNNVSFTGNIIQRGFFDGTNTNLNINRGIMLATGNITVAVGPNDSDGAHEPEEGICSSCSDDDLDDILGGLIPTEDVAVLEFDFTSQSNVLSFNYVFASEEYPEFVCSQFNDVFAFLLSGPKPGGGNYNNENIALIPGTNIPVAINSVNSGTAGWYTGCPMICTLTGGSLDYNGLYNDNFGGMSVQFDGFTDKFQATANVIPCETYHIKLAIADASDGAYDSAVFLEENSFDSGALNVNAVTINSSNNTPQPDDIVESCSNFIEITFSIDQPATTDYYIPFNIDGTAINGVDYQIVPTDFIIPAGTTQTTINIIPIADAISEGLETVTFDIQISPCETQTFIYNIIEEEPLAAPQLLCDDTTESSVSFTWTQIAGATSYEVSLDGGITWQLAAPGPTSHLVTGLSQNQAVDILVRPIGGVMYCNDNPSGSASCMSDSCAPPTEPTTECYETPVFNITTCAWEVTGTPPIEPPVECYETTAFNTTTCTWEITGTPPIEPPVECYETTAFNTTTCTWEITGTPPIEPPVECYETTAFNTTTCTWEVTGTPPVEPPVECYETTAFNTTTCEWEVTGTPPEVDDNCDLTEDSFDEVNCVTVNTPNCPPNTFFNPSTCECETVSVSGCTDPCATNYNPAANVDDGSCLFPEEPTIACYEITIFNTTTCEWEVSGTPPEEPIIECYQTTTFNTTSCIWEITGTPPEIDDNCEFTDDSFNEITCTVINTPNCPAGTTFDAVNCDCTTDVILGCTDPCATNYNPAANVDDGSCLFPEEPTIVCYEMTIFNTTTCEWEISGIPPEEPVAECYQTTIFNNITCEWNIMGEQPEAPIIACNETAVFNNIDCEWEIEIGENFTIENTQVNPPSCHAASDGSIIISTLGGTLPIMYSIDGEGTQASDTFEGLAAGTYEITVTDANNCIAMSSVEITEPTALELTFIPTNPECFDMPTGSIAATVTGGTASYTYAWSNGQNTDNNIGLAQGNYALTVTDANGCTITDDVMLTEPPEIVLSLSTSLVNCNETCDGSASVAASGGTGSLSYIWDDGSTNNAAENFCPGLHSLTVTDARGCTQTEEFTIEEATTVEFELNVSPATCFGYNDGMIKIENMTGGASLYAYSIDGEMFTTNSSMLELAAGTYTVYVQDADGCVYTSEAQVEQPSEIIVDAGPDVELSFGDNIQLSAQINQLPGNDFVFTWFPADGLSCTGCDAPYAMPIQTTNYTVTATNTITGCSASDLIAVLVDKEREVFIPNIFSPDYDGTNDVFMVFGGRGVVEVSSMLVYDRWGELIFENANFSTDAPQQGWDGTFRGRSMNPGVFLYIIEVEFIDGVRVKYSGDVTLTR